MKKSIFLKILAITFCIALLSIPLFISIWSAIPGVSVALIFAGPVMKGARKKLGGVVVYKHLGETCGRERVEHIKNPKTDAQKLARSRFTVLQPVVKKISGLIDSTSTQMKKGQSKYNRVYGWNLKNALQLVSGVWEMLWTGFVYAFGSLPLASNISAANSSGQNITFAWDDNSGEGKASPDDLLTYLWFNTSNNEQMNAITTQKRSDQSFSFAAPASWSGNDIAIYCSFISSDHKYKSDSLYINTLTLH